MDVGPLAIVGAGTMGWQIALQLAAHGQRVRLFDQSREVAARALEQIGQEGPRLADEGLLPRQAAQASENISIADALPEAVAGVWFVLEAIPERLDLKRALFAELSGVTKPETILATNSSSFKSRLLAEATMRPERLLNAHFYNVPWQRRAVELMTCGATNPQHIERVATFLRGCGLWPVIARAESTGFVYNRVWHAIKKECLKVVAEGVATPEEVDRLWCLSHGTPMGPFGMMDRVGLDVVLDIERHYAAESADPKDEPPELLAEMVARGRLGRKSGEGFYRYPHPPWERPGWPRA